MSETLALLQHVIHRQAVTVRPGAIGTKSGFGSTPPINLDALTLAGRLRWASGPEQIDLQAQAMEMIERPHRLPLGECPCGTQVSCEFDRVAGQCGVCGEWINRADAVAAARDWAENAWLTPNEIAAETRPWSKPVTAGQVRKWAHRGRITAQDGRYRFADILAELDRQAANATLVAVGIFDA